MTLLRANLGCGPRFHPAWYNVDLTSTGPGVVAHDLRRGIPLPDKSCEAVYHSHVLEHIPRDHAHAFLSECYRVLAPRGIIRIAVPDLERIVRTYIEKLELALAGNDAARDDYEWIMLELFDQTVRNKPGGGMRDYIAEPTLTNEKFVLERIGEEGKGLIRAIRSRPNEAEPRTRRPLSQRAKGIPSRIRRIYTSLGSRLLLGRDASRVIAMGRMRESGEVHQWMYDRYSLARALATAGFASPVQLTASKSEIPNWTSFNLDTLENGDVIKPDSLFMEAQRPAES